MVTEEAKTVFNSAKITLERLSELFEICNLLSERCRTNGYNISLLSSWHSHLWNIYKEINCKCSKDHVKEITEEFKKLKTFGQLQTYKRSEHDGLIKFTNPKVFLRYWHQLHKIEMILRRIADKKGMLNPTGSDAMGGMM